MATPEATDSQFNRMPAVVVLKKLATASANVSDTAHAPPLGATAFPFVDASTQLPTAPAPAPLVQRPPLATPSTAGLAPARRVGIDFPRVPLRSGQGRHNHGLRPRPNPVLRPRTNRLRSCTPPPVPARQHRRCRLSQT